MKFTKTSKIGVVLAISLIVLIWGINFLKGRDIFRTEKVYFARYKNVGGLEASTIVQLNGLKIGYVREIYFAKDFSGDLIVKIAVFNKFPLPVGTTAEITSSDLLGSKVVKLNMGKSTQFYHTNDTLKTKIEADFMTQVSEQIAPIKAKAEKLIVSLDSIVSGLSQILDSETRKNLSVSIQQISSTMENLEHISGDLSQIVSEQKRNLSSTIINIKDVSDHFHQNAQKIDNIISNFSSISDSINPSVIKETLSNVQESVKSIQSVLQKIENNEGSMGLLVNDSVLYRNLSESTENLNRLLIDVKQNPRRYLKITAFDFGKEVYIAPKESFRPNEHVLFKVFLCSSSSPISLKTSIFHGVNNIIEEKIEESYFYFAGEDNSYEKIRIILNKIQLSFPQASLKAYLDGKEISLKKALKICSE